MVNPENWKITRAQREEIQELWSKLGWKQEDYGEWCKLDELLWHTANALISGARFCLENPKQWQKI